MSTMSIFSYVSKRLEMPIRVAHHSTVWIRPEKIEDIVRRNCPWDTDCAQQLLDDWRQDVVHTVKFAWHTRYTGWFYVEVNGKDLKLCDNEVIRCEL